MNKTPDSMYIQNNIEYPLDFQVILHGLDRIQSLFLHKSSDHDSSL